MKTRKQIVVATDTETERQRDRETERDSQTERHSFIVTLRAARPGATAWE